MPQKEWKHLKPVFAILALLSVCVGLNAVSTFPPEPGTESGAASMLGAARIALFSGDPDRAYRLVQTAVSLEKPDEKALKLEAAIYVAMDMSLRSADCLSRLPGNGTETQRVKAILQRQGPAAEGKVGFKTAGDRILLARNLLRHVSGVFFSPGGGALLLTREALSVIDKKGFVESRKPMNEARDISLDSGGGTVVLMRDRIVWGDKAIPLPAGVKDPSSIAISPDGTLVLLDSDSQKLYRIDEKGAPLGAAALLIDKPIKVRMDGAGRIYVGDKDGRSIHVFGADLSPLRTITPSGDARLKRLEDFQVDYSGNIIVLDGRAHSLLLFSSRGLLLGRYGGGGQRVDAFGWDGLFSIAIVDRKAGYIGRITL